MITSTQATKVYEYIAGLSESESPPKCPGDRQKVAIALLVRRV